MEDLPIQTLMLLAYVFLHNDKYEEARDILEALNLLQPQDPYICRSLSYCHYKQEDYAKALDYAERSMMGDKDGIDKHASTLLKAKALWRMGKEEAARHSLQMLLHLEI